MGSLNINSSKLLELTELKPDWLWPCYWPNIHSIYTCMKIETLIRYNLHKSFSLNIQILGKKCVCWEGERKRADCSTKPNNCKKHLTVNKSMSEMPLAQSSVCVCTPPHMASILNVWGGHVGLHLESMKKNLVSSIFQHCPM